MANWEYTETELWRFGKTDIAIYHVFSSIATDDAVLVFSEARYGKGSDAGQPHDIHMRRSTDGGRSFSENVCLIPSGGIHCWTNPVPVYDFQTKRLFLFYSDNPDNAKTVNFLIHSDDQGLTWSAPRQINDILEASENSPSLHLAGPGHGIQLKNGPWAGRLLLHFWHRYQSPKAPMAERGYSMSVLYSDDHGETWTRTRLNGFECFANESGIAETRRDLIRVIRGTVNTPFISRSEDGGLTWSNPHPAALPPANCCDMGVLHVGGKENFSDMVLVSRVSALEKRKDIEIRISYDGGKTFDDVLSLLPGDAMPGYSDLCLIREEEPVVGLIHCRDNHVLFSRISLQTLTHGKYENTSRTVWLW